MGRHQARDPQRRRDCPDDRRVPSGCFTSFTLAPHTPQVLGRDDRADIILNAEDYQLSGKHCTVEWDGSYLYIQDMGSTNGTVLNGTNLKPDTWSRVKNGAVLHMGSFDYQVALNPEN